MNIILNNRNETFEYEQLSIKELLAVKKFSFQLLVIKVNGELVRLKEYETTMVKEGDNVMILHLITGG